MKKALIIFVRNPELGKVKTRLAKSVGDEKALEIYKDLLRHTHEITLDVACDKFIFYADAINTTDIWENNLFNKELQSGIELGQKMNNAFLKLFQKGYCKIVIIGSDCPSLTTGIIEEAFAKLDEADVIIGPSKDGGYYLLGLSDLITGLFENKEWSTDKVFAGTLENIHSENKKYALLPKLADIDTIEDYNDHYLSS